MMRENLYGETGNELFANFPSFGPLGLVLRHSCRYPEIIRLRTIHKLDSVSITSSWLVFLASPR